MFARVRASPRSSGNSPLTSDTALDAKRCIIACSNAPFMRIAGLVFQLAGRIEADVLRPATRQLRRQQRPFLVVQDEGEARKEQDAPAFQRRNRIVPFIFAERAVPGRDV